MRERGRERKRKQYRCTRRELVSTLVTNLQNLPFSGDLTALTVLATILLCMESAEAYFIPLISAYHSLTLAML